MLLTEQINQLADSSGSQTTSSKAFSTMNMKFSETFYGQPYKSTTASSAATHCHNNCAPDKTLHIDT